MNSNLMLNNEYLTLTEEIIRMLWHPFVFIAPNSKYNNANTAAYTTAQQNIANELFKNAVKL